jgi:hypothetical protein
MCNVLIVCTNTNSSDKIASVLMPFLIHNSYCQLELDNVSDNGQWNSRLDFPSSSTHTGR